MYITYFCIIFYLFLIHNHIHAKSNCVTSDLNANCLWMLQGLDVLNRYFKDKKSVINSCGSFSKEVSTLFNTIRDNSIRIILLKNISIRPSRK